MTRSHRRLPGSRGEGAAGGAPLLPDLFSALGCWLVFRLSLCFLPWLFGVVGVLIVVIVTGQSALAMARWCCAAAGSNATDIHIAIIFVNSCLC